ncbi:MAG: MBL fold metallo-hydrolase [Nitrospirae bacterium]|nr:MBL fold metallo-hydrolase [Nitrospirota bacterium]
MSESPTVHRLTLPLPFPIQDINVYLLETGDGLVLIDTGVRTPASWRTLREGLHAHGHRVSSIRSILLTHVHPDHAGQARRIKRHSGARVFAHEWETPAIQKGSFDFYLHPRIIRYLRTQGVPNRLIAANFALSVASFMIRESVRVDEAVTDGQVLRFGQEELRVIHVPGHSYGHMVLYMPEHRILFSADHLLPTITPVPLLQFPDGRPKPKSLADFMSSLNKLIGLAVERVYPSHGEPFEDHLELIRRYRVLYLKRRRKIERLMEERPKTAYELSVDVFGRRARTQMMLTMSEVIGHLEILVDEGRVETTRTSGVDRYTLKGQAA